MKRELLTLLRLVRNRRAAFVHDLLWIPVVIFLAFQLRFNFQMPPGYDKGMVQLMLLAVPLQGFFFWFFGLYRGVWRFASIPDLMRILQSLGVGVVLLSAIITFARWPVGIPRTVLVLYPILLTVGLSGPRLFYRWLKDHRVRLARRSGQRALIVGAGRNGEMLARDLLRNDEYQPVGFLDDDPRKLGSEIHGVRVMGAAKDLTRLIGELEADLVFVAIPDAKRPLIHRIVTACAEARIPSRILPSLRELAGGRIEVARLRPVTVEDLLGRDPVSLDNDAIAAYIADKAVLVSGGGGSIGSELCRQVAALGPSRLIILEHGEFNLYRIEEELKRSFPQLSLHGVLGDVKDAERVHWVFDHFRPQVVFHAAAYKHVPIVEVNPAEGVRNNVLGTRNLADAAHAFQCDRFVMISTDKAVKPTNVMGTTKRVAEIYCQNLNPRSRTRFITVRFGNVLGSAGSVVPLFEQQIRKGGPVTVTHPEITRYFMTIPEAVGLVLQAGSMGEGGEIFVLDMGEPVKIRELAEQMIRLHGLEPDVDVAIQYVGLRPGEKLYEELFHEAEDLKGTHHPKIMLAHSRACDWDKLQEELTLLEGAARSRDPEQVYLHLRRLAPEFTPTHSPTVLIGGETPPRLRVVGSE
ncbi:MAG: polysaccharide biosynthesis protein [Magnetococcales bacterium]|nr:polysaccharide biosynthesis protein [Magnetococcales bacterium]